MIQVTIFRNSNQNCCGFRVHGHAGFAEHGSDIVCAAVSVLAQNTANSIEAFTEDAISGSMDESSGMLEVLLPETVSESSRLLLDSMILGLQSVQDAYGSQYIKIRFEEV